MTFELVRWRLRWMLPALVLLTVTAVICMLAAAQADARAKGSSTEVIVQLRSGTSLSEGRALVRSLGGKVTRRLRIINGLGAVVSPAAADALERDARVRAVSANAAVKSSGMSLSTPSLLQTAFNQSVRAEKAWAKSVVGYGVGVAVVD